MKWPLKVLTNVAFWFHSELFFNLRHVVWLFWTLFFPQIKQFGNNSIRQAVIPTPFPGLHTVFGPPMPAATVPRGQRPFAKMPNRSLQPQHYSHLKPTTRSLRQNYGFSWWLFTMIFFNHFIVTLCLRVTAGHQFAVRSHPRWPLIPATLSHDSTDSWKDGAGWKQWTHRAAQDISPPIKHVQKKRQSQIVSNTNWH